MRLRGHHVAVRLIGQAREVMTSADPGRFGSGTIVALGIFVAFISLLIISRSVGWDPMWRTFGVTPLPPPFFDMHIVSDYAACGSIGIDPYLPHACNVHNYNIPRVWLWLGSLGISGSDSVWLSASLIALAAIVSILLFQGRSWQHGVFALGAIFSPSVMMGVERG